MTPLSARPAYSSDQLSQYLSVVFSQSHPFHDLSKLKDAIVASPIEALSVLQTNHLSRIPWGDIGLHYSETKKLSLDADDLFRKIVVRQLGGYCMEVNAFYANVLRGLGVKLYTTAGRISNTIDGAGVKDPEGFNGW
jgi:arylamine N-acetyltransferase